MDVEKTQVETHKEEKEGRARKNHRMEISKGGIEDNVEETDFKLLKAVRSNLFLYVKYYEDEEMEKNKTRMPKRKERN
ncbi:Hypothetical predicted protein [Octopus vulgaris]|uniref:Uncharacterized protein n=1 Tax=Octopus vulgaris TaxID=6645 RepID=A0AA36B4X0_OCTVU|nr:Hypothetical predicted protein [Octopus vulgaris]